MAIKGMRRLEDYFWVEDPPSKAMEIASLDRCFHQP
ncbi:hypothetical protein Goari_012361, partial [Gossypium aridum]|nr:hypothetical protein [Gossypium aridum]